MRWLLVVTVIGSTGVLAMTDSGSASDWRRLEHGRTIPTPGMKYVDQPYVLKIKDGRWLCMLTVGTLGETVKGSKNFSAITFSQDRGKTWTPPARCLNSYAVPLRTPAGRIYSLTPKQYTWSDDGGKTWARPVLIDAFVGEPENGPGHEGAGWTVAMPHVRDGVMYLPWARIGLSRPPRKTDCFVYRSADILTQEDPAKVSWQRLPEGPMGLRGPKWDQPKNRSEEPHLVTLSDGSLYVVWRTDQSHIGQSISRDGGETWSKPRALTFAPDGERVIKHPLACSSLWKVGERYLLWHHFHAMDTENDYADRNPVWLSGGIEVDTPRGKDIRWSQPEIALYSDDISYRHGRISYPGLLVDDGRYFLFTTQKTVARVHEVGGALLEMLWTQHARQTRVDEEPLLEHAGSGEMAMPKLAPLDQGRGGFTIELAIRVGDWQPGQVLLDSRDGEARGITVSTAAKGCVEMTLSDGSRKVACPSDEGLIRQGRTGRVSFIVDAGPQLIIPVVNDRVCGGGGRRRHGYARLNLDAPYVLGWDRVEMKPSLGDVRGSGVLRVSKGVSEMRIYARPLHTSEVIGNHRAAEGAASMRH